MAETRLSRRLPAAYGVTPGTSSARPYHAFASSAGALHAWRTRDGEFAAHRASLEGANVFWTPASPVYLPSAPEAVVGPGSLAFKDVGGPRLCTWDVEANILHTHTPAAGSRFTYPLWLEGRLWWIEYPESSTGLASTFRLVSALADLSDVSEVGSREVATFVSVDWSAGNAVYESVGALTCLVLWQDNVNHELAEDHAVRLPMDVGGEDGPVASFGGFSRSPPIGLPGPSAKSIGAREGRLLEHTANFGDFWLPAWPQQPAWEVEDALSLHLTDEAPRRAVLFGERDDERVLIRSGLGDTGTPESTFSAGEHPDLRLLPELLYPVEE